MIDPDECPDGGRHDWYLSGQMLYCYHCTACGGTPDPEDRD